MRGYAVQVRSYHGEDWRVLVAGMQSQGRAITAAKGEVARKTRTGKTPAPMYPHVRVTLDGLVVASWTEGVQDVRGGAA